MGAKKGKNKKQKKYPWKDSDTVGAALKKGLVPYVDFMPIPGVRNTNYYWFDTDKKINPRDDRQDIWENLGNIAKNFYDTPGEAIDILVRGSNLFKQRSLNTYILCGLIEKHRKLKPKNFKLNALISENLETYAPYIGIAYDRINPSIRDQQRNAAKYDPKKESRQQIIDKIVEKHRRLVINKSKEFKEWLANHSDLIK
jgi:hypothetical protein